MPKSKYSDRIPITFQLPAKVVKFIRKERRKRKIKQWELVVEFVTAYQQQEAKAHEDTTLQANAG